MTRRERNQSRKGTKRALTSSVLAIALCVVLLAGATFAWFTDTASTKISEIKSGTLKIELQYYKSEADGWVNAEGQTLSFTNVSGETDILWEPGATFVLPKLKVVNKGNLALKYKVVVSSIEGDDELANALKVTLTDGENAPQELGTLKALSEMDVANISENHLSAVEGKTETAELTLAVQMDKAAGNEYQGKSISGVTVTVFATQDTVENDSKDNTYDKDATYATPVATLNELTTALAAGKDVALTENIELTEKVVLNYKDVEINLNGNALVVSKNCGVEIYGDNVTVKNGTIKRAEGTDYSYGLMIKGVNTVIDGVTIDSGINVSGYANDTDNTLKSGVSAEIRNCNITVDGSNGYYTVCVQGNATATLSDSTVTKNNSGKANYYFWIEKEYTEGSDTVGSSSLILKNVTQNSNCSASAYNPFGIAPSTQQ